MFSIKQIRISLLVGFLVFMISAGLELLSAAFIKDVIKSERVSRFIELNLVPIAITIGLVSFVAMLIKFKIQNRKLSLG